jgi:hypothetical protein
MRKGYFLSPQNLAALARLEKDFHANLGADIALRFYKAFPSLTDESHDVLKWILHNQQELVGRCERYKISLRKLMTEVLADSPRQSEAFADCNASLDHVQQNLTFLVGSYGEPRKGSYYTLNSELALLAISRQRVTKHYNHLIERKVSKLNSKQLARCFGNFRAHLVATGCPQQLADSLQNEGSSLLRLCDVYYSEMESLVEAPTNSVILFFHFCRVQAAAMKLLSSVILVQSITEAIWYYLSLAAKGTNLESH